MKVKEAILLLCVVFAPVVAEAQVPVRDNEKKKQWQSMENGPWDFAPDWYYYFLHKGYSGAEMYWKWAGFKSGFRVRFKESKSNIKRIMPTRVISEETQRQKLEKVEEERKYVEELYKEELVREADRAVDLVYPAQGRVQPDAGLHHRRPALLHDEKRRKVEAAGGRTGQAE